MLVVVPLAIPDFVVSFGWASLCTVDPRLPRRGPGDDAGRVPAGLPAGRGQPARRRPRPGGGGAQPGLRPGAHLLPDHARPGPGRHPRRLPAGRHGACWPSTARSRSSATRPSPPRSSPSSSVRSTCPPRARSRWCWSLLSLLVLGGGRGWPGAGAGSAGPAARPSGSPPRHRLGRATGPVLAGFAAPGRPGPRACRSAPASTGWPQAAGASLPGVSMPSATWHTAAYSALRRRAGHAHGAAGRDARGPPPGGRPAGSCERSTYLVLAMPGVVIALSLSYFTERYADGVRLPERADAGRWPTRSCSSRWPWSASQASVAQAPVGLEDVARSLGQRRLAVFRRVTLPLVTPGLAAAFCLVFLSAVDRADRDPDPGARPACRPWPPSSGPTSRTSPTVRPPRSPC